LIELDGCARRLTILPPDTDANHLGAVIAGAEVDAVVVDSGSPHRKKAFDLPVFVSAAPSIVPSAPVSHRRLRTEWVLLTSGTIGVPKMVLHDLASLTAAIGTASPVAHSTASL
jgi:acyl-coenzyme A synthetase/AMP-(fatty) acid ligase